MFCALVFNFLLITSPPPPAQVAAFPPTRTCFRRQALPQLDGPFIPPADGALTMSTRQRETEAQLRNPADSGVAPGESRLHAEHGCTRLRYCGGCAC